MIKVKVTADNDLLQRLAFMPEKMRQRAFPATRQAFDAAANLVQDKWRNWAMGGTLPGVENIKNPSSRLAQSIKVNSEGA